MGNGNRHCVDRVMCPISSDYHVWFPANVNYQISVLVFIELYSNVWIIFKGNQHAS